MHSRFTFTMVYSSLEISAYKDIISQHERSCHQI